MTQTILILGANGKFGKACAGAFAADGWNVRLFDRKSQNMTNAAIGADVIFNGLNPPAYHNWAQIIPEITKQVIAAAKASGATIILPGNVYPFGHQPGIWDENTAHKPNSRKGEIRKQMEAAYRTAALEGVQTINLRAGDIIDPDATDTVFQMVMLKALAKGKLTLLGRADARHAWCFTPDFARAAVGLANMRDTLAAYEDIPLPGQNFTGEELRRTLHQITGRPVKITQFAWWQLRLLSPFWELARELQEMRYLWDMPHELSGQKLNALLPGFQMTPNSQAILQALPRDIKPDQPVMAAHVTV